MKKALSIWLILSMVLPIKSVAYADNNFNENNVPYYYIDESNHKLIYSNQGLDIEIYDEYNVEYIFEIYDKKFAHASDKNGDVYDIILDNNTNIASSQTSISLMSVSGSANETTVFEYLTKTMGLNTAAACGILSNIKSESSFNPNALGDNGTSYGICQWHNDRWTRLQSYCNNNGYDWTTLIGQLHYLEYELKNFSSDILSYISSVSNTADGAYNAGWYWCYHFERPANKENVAVTRGNYAKNTYWEYYKDTHTPVDLGTDYYAYIFNSPAWKTVELGSSNNVQLMTEKWTVNQRWFVHRNTDGSYTFKNADNNRCLDVANAGNANGTNVQTADYNGSDAQKWYIYAVGDKYVFSPKCAPGKVLDLYSGNTDDGTNVQIYDENDTDAQFFTLYQVNPDIPVPAISANATNYKTDGTVSITWDKTGYTDHYTYYLAEYPKGYAYTTNTKNGTVTSPSVSFSGLTSGDYSCFVHSVSHLGTQGGQSNWATFKVYEDDYIPTKTVVKDNHIYALYDYDMSWTFANELCADFGGHLVTITSADEESIVENLINSGLKEAYWLGGTDITDFGALTSTDKVFHWTTGEAFTYSNWKSGEPSATGEKGDKEHFAEIRKSYGNKWNDVNNISKTSKGFILEIEVDNYAPAKTDTYNGHQYMIFDKNTTWSEAKVFCEQLGGHLATIESSAENEYIKSLLKSGERAWYYIGGQKENGTWKWYNGGTATTISWADNASAWTGTNLMMYKSTGNCIGVDNAYYPESDISNMGFVCEIDSTSTPTPTPTPTQKPTTQPTATPTPMPTKEPVVQSFVVTQYDTYADILNDDSAEHSGTVIIAKYDNGVLKNLKTVDVTIAANEKRTFLYGNSGEHKVFVWSSLKGMVSLVK